jgi:hypothetical protein
VSGPPINLYWVTTDDNEEDWFIFARTRRAAASFHENYEGYDTYDASARTILSNVQLVKYVNGPPPVTRRSKTCRLLASRLSTVQHLSGPFASGENCLRRVAWKRS